IVTNSHHDTTLRDLPKMAEFTGVFFTTSPWTFPLAVLTYSIVKRYGNLTFQNVCQAGGINEDWGKISLRNRVAWCLVRTPLLPSAFRSPPSPSAKRAPTV